MAYDPTSPLPDTQEGILQAILLALNTLVANSPIADPATRRGTIQTIGGNVPLFGAGPSASATGGATLRVSPANDTLAGATIQGSKPPQDINSAGLINLYQFIQVT